ncbi:MAG TPA: polysaccharide biosynthesis protein [Gaiellaceae bacterium]|nr:polysaccharide biosynthesis protein [Gaiellaceae bacterium]
MGRGSDVGSANGSLEALLGRPTIPVRDAELGGYVAGATVLVTGAAGCLGTALSGRLARLGAGTLVLVDHAEAPLCELTAVLRDDGFDGAVPVLADLRRAARAYDVVERHRPDVIFHAAAYKQVPLLEAHPVEGVATNVLATRHMVAAARTAGVERFVLFSTDKAVQPTSVLGRTKALAEWLVAAAGHPRYTSVRLANVVDSTGSIVPLFRRQIARGGPVTVTHPHTTRYLMTSSEAVGLAIVAGAEGDSESVCWLDVGPPVRVLDLARRLVGDAPVKIELVGLRPGERVHEQLCAEGEEVRATSCERVYRSPLPRVNVDWLEAWMFVLERAVEESADAAVRAALDELLGVVQEEKAAPLTAGVAR